MTTIPPVMILALLLAAGVGLYVFLKHRTSNPTGQDRKRSDAPPAGAAAPEDNPAKAAALDQFRAAHAAARDKRKQLQKTVASDPARATKAIRSMMKR